MLAFIDLDDVLNCFTEYCLERMGSTTKLSEVLERDIVKYSGLGLSAQEFWDRVPYEVWSDCPKSELFDFTIKFAVGFAGESNVFILTSPVDGPGCIEGKISWIEKYWPFPGQYIITKHKHLLAGPDRLLIDDSVDNINSFRKGGGIGILFPRPWN